MGVLYSRNPTCFSSKKISSKILFSGWRGSTLIVVLRVSEGVYALEAPQGGEWARLKKTEIALSHNQQYKLRFHCFGGRLILFPEEPYMFEVSDLGFKQGKISCTAIGGETHLDNMIVWGHE